jgi:hypothetical protein
MPYLATTATASVLVHDLITGPLRGATVVASGPAASYLDVDGRLLAVLGTGSVRLPCAVVAGGSSSPFGREGLVEVGDGAVHVGGRPAVEIRRWFDPRLRLGPLDPAAVCRLDAALASRPCPDPLLAPDAVERLAGGLAGGEPDRAVAALVGRGSGLTPTGDDLLAGALAALRAVGSALADPLGAAVRAHAPGRTTRLSAALLADADDGAVIPEAATVLRGLTAPAALGHALEPALDRLVAVGHTSGWHLAAGLAVGAGAVGACRSVP